MSQVHNIFKSFKDRVASTAALNAALAGGLHHGQRVDTTIVRPYGRINARETGREGLSGATALVRYEVELTIVGNQAIGDMGAAQTAFAAAFNLTQDLPSVVGQVIMSFPLECTIAEDPDSEFGKDIIIGKQTWEILIQETQ